MLVITGKISSPVYRINDPEGGLLNVKSDLNFALLREFHAQGIEIPYPQREVLLREPVAQAVK